MTDSLNPETDSTAKQIKQLQKSQELIADVIATASYETRTPLNMIIGYSHLLEKQELGPLNEKQQTSVRYIYENSRYLLNIIEYLTIKLPLILLHSSVNIYTEDVDLEELIKEIGLPIDNSQTFKGIPLIQTNKPLLRSVLETLLTRPPSIGGEKTPTHHQIFFEVNHNEKQVAIHFDIDNDVQFNRFWEGDIRLSISQIGIESLGGELSWDFEEDTIRIKMSLPIKPDLAST